MIDPRAMLGEIENLEARISHYGTIIKRLADACKESLAYVGSGNHGYDDCVRAALVFSEAPMTPDPHTSVAEHAVSLQVCPPGYVPVKREDLERWHNAMARVSALESKYANQFLELKRREKEAFDNGIKASQLEGEVAKLKAENRRRERQAFREGIRVSQSVDDQQPEDCQDCDQIHQIYRLKDQNARLRAAIVSHRGQKADDRCIEDDDRLYESLGDGIKCDRRVGDKAAMLGNCERFINNRCEGGGWPSYVELESEITRLKGQRDRVAKAAKRARYFVSWIDSPDARNIFTELDTALAECEAKP